MSTMERLSELANKQLEAERAVVVAEEVLKTANQNLTTIREEILPQVMEELELETFTTTDGLKITIIEKTFGNITEDNRPTAFTWLRANGHGGIIKDKLEASPKDEKVLARLLAQLAKKGHAVRDTSSVHYQTLGKWVREMRADGSTIPDSIGVTEKMVSKVATK